MKKFYWIGLIPIIFITLYYGIEVEKCYDYYVKVGEKYDLTYSTDIFGGMYHFIEAYWKDQCKPKYIHAGHTLTQQLMEVELFLLDETYTQRDLDMVIGIYQIHSPNKIEYCASALTHDLQEFGIFVNYTDGKIIEHNFIKEKIECKN